MMVQTIGIGYALSKRHLLVGDRVEVTMTNKGGFYNGRYLGMVTNLASSGRIRIREDEGRVHLPFLSHMRKLAW